MKSPNFASPVLQNVGLSPLAVLGAQTFLVGMMVGELSKRAQINSQLERLEQTYILENGTENEIQQLVDNVENSQNHNSLKKGLLISSAVLLGSMVVLETVNNGVSTFLTNSMSAVGGLSALGAGVMHLYDKLASTDRGRLAHTIAKRRNETQSPAPGTPQAKSQI